MKHDFARHHQKPTTTHGNNCNLAVLFLILSLFWRLILDHEGVWLCTLAINGAAFVVLWTLTFTSSQYSTYVTTALLRQRWHHTLIPFTCSSSPLFAYANYERCEGTARELGPRYTARSTGPSHRHLDSFLYAALRSYCFNL